MKKSARILKKHIPGLVWLGFGLLILLGLATSIFLMAKLRDSILNGQRIEVATLNVRAAVRSLHSYYLDQELNRALLSPQPEVKIDEYRANQLKSDEHIARLIIKAVAMTNDNELRRTLINLQKHDREVTVPIAQKVMNLARTDLPAARQMFLTDYLPAQDWNLEAALKAQRLAIEEIAAMTERTRQEAKRAQFTSALSIGAYLTLGLVTAFLLTRAVSGLVRQASEATRETNDLMDHSMDIICSISAEGRFLKINKACEKILGYRPEELLGRPYLQFVHPDDIPSSEQAAASIIEGTAFGHFENRYRRKDGSIVHMLWSTHWLAGQQTFFCVAHDTTERKETEARLASINKELQDLARQAGMAEVATSVLHNVGNVLNSVNVSCALVAEKIRKSKIGSVVKSADLLRQHAGDLPAFLTADPAGKKFPDFLGKLAGRLVEEQTEALDELHLLSKNIDHIKDIVSVQQDYARVSGVTESVNLVELVEDSLRMNSGSLLRHAVNVNREYGDVPMITVEKHKVLQILINLIRNAKHACDDSDDRPDRLVTVRLTTVDSGIRIAIIDNGIGIAPENMTRIFAHGFTTKIDGHGFGLHSGALTAKELGGSLTVQSDGPGTGATFTLDLPLAPPSSAQSPS